MKIKSVYVMKNYLNRDNHDLIIFINKIDFITGTKLMVELVEFTVMTSHM